MSFSNYPGPFCRAQGITNTLLLAATGSKPKRLPKLPEDISNGIVIELEMFRKHSTAETYDVLKSWVLGLTSKNIFPVPTTSAFSKAVKTAIQKQQQLSKSNNSEEFLQEPFRFPISHSVCHVSLAPKNHCDTSISTSSSEHGA